MTLREVLKKADLDEVYRLINKKDSNNIAACDRPPLEETIKSYTHVVKELLSKSPAKPYKLSWMVQESKDPFDGIKYADVCFLNHDYVAPKKGLKPWGCTRGKKPPKGHYNCNADKHSKTFAPGFTPWSKVIDTPIINKAKYSLERVVAEILWEMTFYGWTEERVDDKTNELKDTFKKALKEVDEGKYVELPPKKPGQFKVVIPDSVSQQIIDIATKRPKK